MNKIVIPLLILVALLPIITGAEGLLVYKPPQTGAPVSRIGGGTRGFSLTIPQVIVLAPRHTALTNQAQPTLYWYLSETNHKPIKIKLIQKDVDEPLLDIQLPPPENAGLQSIALADHDIFLTIDETYHWSVAVIDTKDLSDNTVAKADILYQIPATPLSSIEQQAEAGYWYDVLQQLIESHSPLVNSLLKQADIDIPAL